MSSTTLDLLISLLRKVWGALRFMPSLLPQVVVGHNGGGLDARPHQKVHQHRLELGLPALEVVTRNQHLAMRGRYLSTDQPADVHGANVDASGIRQVSRPMPVLLAGCAHALFDAHHTACEQI